MLPSGPFRLLVQHHPVAHLHFDYGGLVSIRTGHALWTVLHRRVVVFVGNWSRVFGLCNRNFAWTLDWRGFQKLCFDGFGDRVASGTLCWQEAAIRQSEISRLVRNEQEGVFHWVLGKLFASMKEPYEIVQTKLVRKIDTVKSLCVIAGLKD